MRPIFASSQWYIFNIFIYDVVYIVWPYIRTDISLWWVLFGMFSFALFLSFRACCLPLPCRCLHLGLLPFCLSVGGCLRLVRRLSWRKASREMSVTSMMPLGPSDGIPTPHLFTSCRPCNVGVTMRDKRARQCVKMFCAQCARYRAHTRRSVFVYSVAR